MPYWRPDAAREADSITTIDLPRSALRGVTITFGVRVVDAQGLVVDGAFPSVTVAGGTVTKGAWSSTAPGMFEVQIKVLGDMSVQVKAGAASQDAQIRAF